MTKITWVKQMKRYFIEFKDGSIGWCSKHGLEHLFPNRNWSIVKENSGQAFYL